MTRTISSLLYPLITLPSSMNSSHRPLKTSSPTSAAIFVVVVDEGEGNYEVVGLREEEVEEEVTRYSARLSEGDFLVIPAGHPLSNLSLLGFGINAHQNQMNFLAGLEDNVIRS
ncbi:PREDICTED: conglutin beta 3-like [Lupinus angustifolius]|uniref:conglutin beta 3-like n=1 Tax=Lupinus angustifolius TaxID=3871 RepID=UPI00092E5EEA|nr:PREDICTED: conglutin beta 3-like [Lupinus angustifolius]